METQSKLRPKTATVQYAILAVLILITAAYQVRHFLFVFNFARGHIYAVQGLGQFRDDQPLMTEVEPGAAKAGLKKGDTLLALEDQRLTGFAQVARALEYAHPGDLVKLTVRHGTGATETLALPLLARKQTASDHWLFVFALFVVMPLTCAVLGFWVALLRPRERLAWLLLALLMGFSQVFGLSMENYDGALASTLAVTFKGVLSGTWILWLFLLGIYFPERLAFERRHGWIKNLLIVPLAIFTVIDLIFMEAGIRSYAAYQALDRAIPVHTTPVQTLNAILVLGAIVGFFVLIVAKYFVAASPDAKRRLRLLYGGMFFALAPTITLVIVSLALDKRLDDFPAWIELPCLLASLLFPMTLAYIIVAYRAMDIQVVVRQGVRYTLARKGVGALQGIVSGGLVIAMARLVQQHEATPAQLLLILSAGVAAIFMLRRGAQSIGLWVDRRFFRDSYHAEQVLMELSDEVRTIVEMQPLLETVSRKISSSLHVSQLAVLLHGGSYRLAYAQGFGDPMQAEFGEGSVTVRQLLEEKRPTRVYLEDPNNWVNRDIEVQAAERGTLEALRSELLVPLQAAGRLLGFISLGQKRSEEPYSRTDLQLLGSVAAQTGLALENARLTSAVAEEAAQREAMKREVEIAREVQERLFPQNLPPVGGLDYFGTCRPARGVGGDYYDFLPLPGSEMGLAIGDVAGKGISAALMMASLQASLRGQTMTGLDDLAAVVGRVNRLVYEVSSPERYATFFFARYQPASRKLTYVNAGHNPPMLLHCCRGQWTLRRLEVGGTVVGLLPQVDYAQDVVQLAPGDVLAAYTDGISEAMNERDEEWGEEQLLETLKACDGKSAAETVGCIMQSADRFTAGAKQYDDMTIVVLKLAVA